MAGMDPTAAELAAMVTMQEVLNWADVEGDHADPHSTAASLLGLIGARINTKPRVLSAVTENDASTLIRNWRIRQADGTDRAPTLVESGQAGLVFRACRLVGGKGQSIEDLQNQLIAAKAAPLGLPPPVAKAASPIRKVKMSSIASQVDDSEVSMMEESELVKLYKEYESVYGPNERPPKDCEPTVEQISVVSHLLDSGLPPFTDFALFGPFGHRIERKVKLSGMTISRDGNLRQVELHGPPNIGTWMASYNVLMTILIMKKAVDLGVLLKYRSHIERLHDRYSEKVWAVIYQAESRCRLELMDRLRREAVAEHESILSAGGVSKFDVTRPWNTAWQKATNCESFWREEVIEPGMLILTKTAGLNEMVDGDASVRGGSSGVTPREVQPGPSRMATTTAASGVRPRKQNRSGRIHQIEGNKYTHNRTGYRLCEGFQTGQCNTTSGGIWCAQQWDTTHQCHTCLGGLPSQRIAGTWVHQEQRLERKQRWRKRKEREQASSILTNGCWCASEEEAIAWWSGTARWMHRAGSEFGQMSGWRNCWKYSSRSKAVGGKVCHWI